MDHDWECNEPHARQLIHTSQQGLDGSNCTTTTFTYKPLPEKSMIRLFSFHQNPITDMLELKLQVADTRLACDYCTLSYCWGPPDNSEVILVNGARHTIRKNLHDFLVSILRGRKTTIDIDLFWADQISINQGDLTERNEQVRMMELIYASAKVIYAYTGEYSPNAQKALDAMFPRPGVLPPQGTEIEDIVEEFCQREYWYRLWIVQEIYVAIRVLFWCGSYAVSSDDQTPIGILETAMFQTRRTERGQHVVKVKQMQSSYRLTLARSKPRTAMSLSRAVIIFSDQRCSDPRDKIFGLQGIVFHHQRVPADYSKTVDKIFEQATKRFIQYCQRPKTFTDLQCFYVRAGHTERDVAVLAEQLLGHRIHQNANSLLATLCWAHWILHMPHDRRLHALGKNSASWEPVWRNVAASAVTDRQKALATDLHERFLTLHEQWDTSAQSAQLDASEGITSDLQELIRKAVIVSDFKEVDAGFEDHGFLIHPEDSPLPWREAMTAL